MQIPEWGSYKYQFCKIGGNHWSVDRLIQLSKDFDVMDVPLDHINVYFTYNDLRARDFVMHMKAVLDCDLKCPIILDEDGEIMDGRHRLMRAMLEGKKTIKAVRFDENPRPCKTDD